MKYDYHLPPLVLDPNFLLLLLMDYYPNRNCVALFYMLYEMINTHKVVFIY